MLSVQRLKNVLQKLQCSDLAKFLIQRATAAVGGSGGAGAIEVNKMPSQVDTVSKLSNEQMEELKRLTTKFSAVSFVSTSDREDSLNLVRNNQSNSIVKMSESDLKNTNENHHNGNASASSLENGVGCDSSSSSGKGKACFKSSLADILQFLELVGSLKHTKRTGWVLRDIPDCESISGHMYRMSMMTFLLDGTEGLSPIRCMELALVHDLAESLVGDITPFCGIPKEEKRAREFKAMEDICKLIEPRGKRIMQLFEEYEAAESAESKFVKDLDRLDMVLQAFEYEKRDDCVMKHQEFFDSTHGKFNHPFVVKLVNEIYEQRKTLAKEKGVTQNGDSDSHCGEQDQEKKVSSS